VLSEAHRQRLIAGRCWEVYDLITRTFTVQPEFTGEFPELAEQALITGALSLRIQIEQDRFLQIEEEHDFREHELIIETYSYLLLNQAPEVVIRADSLPHHQRDYRIRGDNHTQTGSLKWRPPVYRYRAEHPAKLTAAHTCFNLHHHLVVSTRYR